VRLVDFHVRHFRNFIDSQPVPADEEVTCLVGKNESGKTAALQALYRLNPAHGEKFDVQQHFPRFLLKRRPRRGEKKVVPEKAQPISATFELNDQDVAALSGAVGADVLKSRTVVITRDYEDKLYVDASTEAESVEALRREEGQEERDVRQEVRNTLARMVPVFFYFSDYSTLPGRTDLTEVAGDEADSPAASEKQTVRALLALADTSVEDLREDTYEARKAELEAVSNELTREVQTYWRQNEDLKVEIDVDKQTVKGPRGPTAVARYLEVRVEDRRHGYTNNFNERSSGFQWFFSFLAAFSEFEDYKRDVIVLLDEPGLTLHATAQADFLYFIDDRLAPERQVVYTTHSPFMVEADRLKRVRIVEDKGPETGAVISTDVLSVGADSAFPLQAALGYDLSQHLFVGPHNLLVEGTSDFTYLTTISNHLRDQGRAHLDERWRVLPTGGAQNIPAFVALLGRQLDVTVLADAANKGMQRLTDLANKGLLERNRLITVGEIINAKNADIEDLFDVQNYLDLYNPAFKTKAHKTKLPPGDRIVKRLAALDHGGKDYDHGLPADYLLRNRDKLLPKLKPVTLDNFERLFERLNDTLD
jgi:predicted ATP-dependent endonuclease of OLD family